MSTDTTLTCRDCGQAFIFSSGEQDFFATRGLDNGPTGCPSCRAQRRAFRGSLSTDSISAGEREMFSAICATCGKEALVPFQPGGEKAVYCSDCFRQRGRSITSYSRRSKS
jgi:CxxC-x17-CxxC domain-containing protein